MHELAPLSVSLSLRDVPMTAESTADHSSTRLRVRYAETDQMSVVYHTHYLVWCEVGRTDLLRELGESYAEVERRGVVLAVAEAQARYHAPARYDDLIEVRTRVDGVKSRTVTFGYEIHRIEPGPPARLVTASTTLIALGPDGAPRLLPTDLKERLHAALASRQNR